MAEYSKLYITNNGQALMAKMIAGSGNIDFTKVCSSSTQYTESQLQALTALSNIKQTTLVSKVTRTNEVAIKIDAAYSNVDLKEGYYMRTLGLYAVDPDKGEILYAVCIEKSNKAGWKGLCRKCMTLIFVLVAYRLDLVIGTNYIRDAVIIAFIANETISLVENAGLMGVPLPPVITKAIDILQKKTESEGK